MLWDDAAEVIGWTFRDLAHAGFRGQLDAALCSAVALLTVGSWIWGDRSPLFTLDRAARWLGIDISNPLTSADVWFNVDHRRGVLIAACAIVLGAALLAEASRRSRGVPYRIHEVQIVPEDRSSVYGARWLDSEVRFWSRIWILAGLAAELRVGTWTLTLLCFVVIIVVRGIIDVQATSIVVPISAPRLAHHLWSLREENLWERRQRAEIRALRRRAARRRGTRYHDPESTAPTTAPRLFAASLGNSFGWAACVPLALPWSLLYYTAIAYPSNLPTDDERQAADP